MVQISYQPIESDRYWSSRIPDIVWQTDLESGRFGFGDFDLADEVEGDNIGGLRATSPIESAIILLLFSDRRRADGVKDYSDSRERRGWFGDGFDLQEGETELGSLLWTLERAPLTAQTGILAASYASDALQPLIDQGVCSHFDVSHEIDAGRGWLMLLIAAHGMDGELLYQNSFKV